MLVVIGTTYDVFTVLRQTNREAGEQECEQKSDGALTAGTVTSVENNDARPVANVSQMKLQNEKPPPDTKGMTSEFTLKLRAEILGRQLNICDNKPTCRLPYTGGICLGVVFFMFGKYLICLLRSLRNVFRVCRRTRHKNETLKSHYGPENIYTKYMPCWGTFAPQMTI